MAGHPRGAPGIETVAALPGLSFVVDHISKPPIASGELEPWASWVRELATYSNVTCKLSGMVTEASWTGWTVGDLRPYAEVVLEAFGPERVMFGSDWPVCLLAASYGQVVDAAGLWSTSGAGRPQNQPDLSTRAQSRRPHGIYPDIP